MKRIAIFASGNGSNAENIAWYLKKTSNEVALILSNKKDAYVLERAKKLGIKHLSFDRALFTKTTEILKILENNQIDLIVLAGFLWLVPEYLIKAYPNRIINIHPALLPKFGGKGMFGAHVHEAVIAKKETVSGITIHYVSERYDEGAVIFQAECKVEPNDTPDSLAAKIHELEYKHFPEQIEKLL